MRPASANAAFWRPLTPQAAGADQPQGKVAQQKAKKQNFDRAELPQQHLGGNKVVPQISMVRPAARCPARSSRCINAPLSWLF